MSAINILKSHGSTFDEGVIVNCEEDEFDVKYVLVLNAHKSDKIIRYGDDPFNRCVKDAYVTNLIFFEEVTVEELAYSHILAYDCYRLFRFYDYDSIIEAKNTPDNIEYRFLSKDYGISYDLIIDGKAFGGFSSFKTEHDDYTELTEVHFKKVLDSIEFIGFDD